MNENTMEGTCKGEGLKVRGLRFAYQTLFGTDKFAVQNITFQIEKGYIYGLVGRNGAGKTTLLNAILKGEYMEGKVSLDGISMEEEPLQVKENFGFITYPAMLLPKESLRRNGEILGAIYENWSQQDYESKLQEFGLESERLVTELSKGENIKAQAAFVWGHKPKVLIADEPTAGLDPKFRNVFIQFLQEYVEDGEHSVLFSTHITEDLDSVGDYLLLMDEGEMICKGSVEELRERYGEQNFSVSWLLRKLTQEQV